MHKDKTRFKYHLANDTAMRFFLKISDWEEYEFCEVSDDMIIEAKAGIVSYPSGEAMFIFGSMFKVPECISFNIGPIYNDEIPGYTTSLERYGVAKVKIFHGDSLSQGEDPRSHYSTSVTNLSDHKIRVIKFAPYTKSLLGRLKLDSRGFYSPTQFKEWFRVNDTEGWIQPNETVCDPDNFGFGKGRWVYFFKNETGDVFIGTAVLGRNCVG